MKSVVVIVVAIIGRATTAYAGKVTCLRDLTAAGLKLRAARGDIDDASKNCLLFLLPPASHHRERCRENVKEASTRLVEANAHVLDMNDDCEGDGVVEACAGDVATFETALQQTIDAVNGAGSRCFAAHGVTGTCVESVVAASLDIASTIKEFDSLVHDCDLPKARTYLR